MCGRLLHKNANNAAATSILAKNSKQERILSTQSYGGEGGGSDDGGGGGCGSCKQASPLTNGESNAACPYNPAARQEIGSFYTNWRAATSWGASTNLIFCVCARGRGGAANPESARKRRRLITSHHAGTTNLSRFFQKVSKYHATTAK